MDAIEKAKKDRHQEEKEDPSVVQIIQEQLGGRRLSAMLGVSQWREENENTLGVKFRATAKQNINYFTVEYLPGPDAYTLRFFRWSKQQCHVNPEALTLVAEHAEIYAEDLLPLIESETGLYTRL